MSTANLYHIAIVGPTDMVSGFKALGVEAFDATNAVEAIEQLRTIKQISNDPTNDKTYAIVCVIDDVIQDVDQAEYAKVVAGALPAVVVLPGPSGASGVALERLRKLAEKAVGSAII
jgi:vacuolar-type H+-ATPase subunit F/Vma7